MATESSPTSNVTVTSCENGIFVTIPWKQADGYQTYFRGIGVKSILHLDPAAREARLQVHTDLPLDRVRDMAEGFLKKGATVGNALPIKG